MLEFLMNSGAAKNRTRTAEATDWITKYFMAASGDFFLFGVEDRINVQKAKVFISRDTHTKSHEFLERTARVLVTKVGKAIALIMILISFNKR
jgi:hypothetical protein